MIDSSNSLKSPLLHVVEVLHRVNDDQINNSEMRVINENGMVKRIRGDGITEYSHQQEQYGDENTFIEDGALVCDDTIERNNLDLNPSSRDDSAVQGIPPDETVIGITPTPVNILMHHEGTSINEDKQMIRNSPTPSLVQPKQPLIDNHLQARETKRLKFNKDIIVQKITYDKMDYDASITGKKNMAVGIYLYDRNVVQMSKICGNVWKVHGFHEKNRDYLHVEEALILIEKSILIVTDGNGVRMTLRQFYEIVLQLIDLPCYLTYTKLKVSLILSTIFRTAVAFKTSYTFRDWNMSFFVTIIKYRNVLTV